MSWSLDWLIDLMNDSVLQWLIDELMNQLMDIVESMTHIRREIYRLSCYFPHPAALPWRLWIVALSSNGLKWRHQSSSKTINANRVPLLENMMQVMRGPCWLLMISEGAGSSHDGHSEASKSSLKSLRRHTDLGTSYGGYVQFISHWSHSLTYATKADAHLVANGMCTGIIPYPHRLYFWK